MPKLLLNKAFNEYHMFPHGEQFSNETCARFPEKILFRNDPEKPCVTLLNRTVNTRHFVGVDWLVEEEQAIYVQPRMNSQSQQTNYLEMLSKAMLHPELESHMQDLFEVKFDKPYIEIHTEEDLLTPLLIGRFIVLVRTIVKKGLKKTYYRTTKNLSYKLKGRILQAKTVKENHLRNRNHMTFCQFEDYGVNTPENKFIKHVLHFCRQYLSASTVRKASAHLWSDLQFVLPAFRDVSEGYNTKEAKKTPYNPFYAEYKEAVHIGSLIVRRFGYNISNISDRPVCMVPPFWIDMSKLFELYVYNLLKEKFSKHILYQFKAANGIPDILLPYHRILVEVKYKPQYENDHDNSDVQQVSAYARDVKVQEQVGDDPYIVIFYPTLAPFDSDWDLTAFTTEEIKGYQGVYKFGITLPTIPNSQINPSPFNSQMVNL